MDKLESDFKETCLVIGDRFQYIVLYLQEELKNQAMNSELQDVAALQVKYKYLSEIQSIIKNESTILGDK